MAIPEEVGNIIDSILGGSGNSITTVNENGATGIRDPGIVGSGAYQAANKIGTIPVTTVAVPAATAASYTAIPSNGLTPQGIADIYNTLAPMAGDYANANIGRAGQAQASYGPLAAAAMGNSRTAGIGNYTYNRLARPAVDSMRNELVVQGLSDALNKQLNDSLRQAQENYNRAARRHSLRSSGGNSTTDTTNVGSGQTKIGGAIDDIVGGNGSNNPNVLYNSYMIIEPDGTSRTYNRPSNMDDQQWWDWTETQRRKAESEGKTFRRVPSAQ